MVQTARSPTGVKGIAILKHFNCRVQCQCLRCVGSTERFAGRTITQWCRTGVCHAVVAVRSNLRITQSHPNCGLRAAEIHICCKISCIDGCLCPTNELIECHAGIRFSCYTIDMHICDFTGHSIRLAGTAWIGLRMICTVCPNHSSVAGFRIHRPYISRGTVLLEPCLLRAAVPDVIGFFYLDFNWRGFVVLIRCSRSRYDCHAGQHRCGWQRSSYHAFCNIFHILTCFFEK